MAWPWQEWQGHATATVTLCPLNWTRGTKTGPSGGVKAQTFNLAGSVVQLRSLLNMNFPLRLHNAAHLTSSCIIWRKLLIKSLSGQNHPHDEDKGLDL